VALVYCQSCALLLGWSFLDEPETVRTVYDVFRHWKFLGEWTPPRAELYVQPQPPATQVENSDPSVCSLQPDHSHEKEVDMASDMSDIVDGNEEDPSEILMSDDDSSDEDWQPGMECTL
jgi:hypothetical protein